MIADVFYRCLAKLDLADDVGLLALFLTFMVTLAATRNLVLLATFNAICTVSILLGRVALSATGLNFFTGAIFLAVMMFGLALKQHVYGREHASRALNNLQFVLLVVFGALFLLDRAGLLNPVFDTSISRAAVRVSFLYFTQLLLILVLDRSSRTPPLIRIPLVIMGMEILEGVLFYPVALVGAGMTEEIYEYTISGIALRLLATLMAVPFLAAFLYMERRGLTVPRCPCNS